MVPLIEAATQRFWYNKKVTPLEFVIAIIHDTSVNTFFDVFAAYASICKRDRRAY